jgi:transcription antitermination factor NusG
LGLHITENKKYWYAVYTRSRYEKKLYNELIKLEIEAFLPVHKTLRQWSDRKKVVEVPLFTSYVFVHIDRTEYDTVLQTHGAVRYVGFEGKAVTIPQQQIDNLKLLVNSEYEIENSSRNYFVGQKVEVKMGTLKGLSGELIQKGPQNRVLIRIDHLDQNLLVNIPLNYLQ